MEEELTGVLAGYTKNYHVRSRNLTMNGMDMIVELRVKDGGSLLKEVGKLKKIRSVSLLSHDGEVTY